MTAPVPCSPAEAAGRALVIVGRPEPYVLGAGDYTGKSPDLPFTQPRGIVGCDCWGLAGAWAYKLPRHRPGFNRGAWSTVSDDINCDSAIEDAEHRQDLFELAQSPAVGDLLVYPSIRGPDRKRIRIGHVGIITGVPAEWDPATPQYELVEVVQCQASIRPAIMRGPGRTWANKSQFRGLRDDSWRTRIVRVKHG